jgi:hypothetical protein
MKRLGMALGALLALLVAGCALTEGQPPPLPLHGIEGVGGVFATHSALLVNPAKEGDVAGLPAVGAAYVHLGNGRHLEAFTLTETLGDRLELGYGLDDLDLGDLPREVQAATGISMGDHSVKLHNFNARVLLAKEGDFDLPGMPAITVGAHYKHNEDTDGINRDLGGLLDVIGVEDDEGLDFTLYATKTVTALPRPVLLNVGLRSTEAAHLGLLGFTDDRELLLEGNVIVLATDRLCFAAEYRDKPDEYMAVGELVRDEDDWWTLCAAYVVSDNLTVSGGYGHFGDLLNHKANGAWGVKLKWEF